MIRETQNQRSRTPEILAKIKDRLVPVFGPRLRGVILFGSEARGDATADSDIDVMVLLAPPLRLGSDLETIISALYPLQLECDRIIEAIPVDEQVFASGEFALHRNAQREGIRA